MLIQSFCLTCIINQVHRVCRYLNLDESTTWQVLQAALRKTLALSPRRMTPPEFSEPVYRVFERVTGQSDPYRNLRKEQNDFILKNIDFFRHNITRSPDPLQTAALYSLTGNLIDFGSEKVESLRQVFNEVSLDHLALNHYDRFASRLGQAQKILIIADNAGEAVLDLLFIREIKREYPRIDICYAVRSRPIINDIIRADAEYIGITREARVIESGCTFPGTILSRCTKDFRSVFLSADLVISKGQGNFETLEDHEPDILFLFKVKCRVIAAYTGLPPGSLLFAFKDSLRPRQKEK